MTTEKSPAFQFYPKDFLTDETVLSMSYTERGIYVTLLSICWLETSLPADAVALGALLHLPAARVKKLWEGPLGRAFDPAGNGRIGHKRLDEEREKQDAFRRRQTYAADKRWNKPGDATAVPPLSRRNALRSPISHLQTPVSTARGPTANPPSDDLAELAGRFLERYQVLFQELRRGARYHPKPPLDFSRACDLLHTWDFARLEKMARVFLTTDDDWISGTDRGFGVFCARATWCDDRLRAVEKPAVTT